MASLIPGFEYDIFISYRQKDNKHDGWVTEFVDQLKGELESTFKEEVSVYFDINPHDGLLETHEVGDSLKEKLKCLVFIPIISRTYCDPKSFAWEHEFKAFVEQASQDQFGLKIKIPNGNVASRVLPVRIYDLDPADIKLCESVLGGVLRGVEFIYKSAGVNRPLRSKEENPQENLNHTIYRDQINKVGNAIKEIIGAINQGEHKEEQIHKEAFKPVSVPRESHKTLIITASILTLALIVLGIIFIPKLFKFSEPIEKSIAVLPFHLLSAEPEKQQYLADGMMDAILLHLSKIEDLRVMSRTSVEQYRNPEKTSPVIGRELNVEYLLEGSFQKSGDNVRLIVKLIRANKDDHIWSNEYDRNWNDIFTVQSEVAQAIARELNTVITPEEKQLIEKAPTENLTAYDFYQRGKEELEKYSSGNTSTRKVIDRAEEMFKKALENDPSFAQAYIGLARVYREKHYWSEYFTENFLDSVLILTGKALSYDNQLAEAYAIRGLYYSDIGKPELAIKEIDKAIELNPNDWSSYLIKAQNSGNDILKGIENYDKVLSLNRGSELPNFLRSVSILYLNAGFTEKAKDNLKEALKLDGDSLRYYLNLCSIETWSGNYTKGLNCAEKVYAIDSTNVDIQHLLGHLNMFQHQYKESLNYFKKYIEGQRAKGNLNLLDMESLGFTYWQIGNKEEAESYFNREIDYCNKAIDLGRSFGNIGAYFELGAIYTIKGERDKAYKNLRIFWQKQELIPMAEQVIYVHIFKNDPMFDNIRNEPEFQQIVRDVDAKYQAEHERVKEWLEEQGML
jgi:TolB-like protein/Tfp pilus assembly protein PilF